MNILLLLSGLLNVFLCGCCIYLSNELKTEKIIEEAIGRIIQKGCEGCRYKKGGDE